MRLRSVFSAGALLAAVAVPADSIHAAPPTSSRVVAAAATAAVASQPSTFWISHEIIPGERLDEIADRYEVSIDSILRWNQLDPNRPQFWIGEKLRIQTRFPDHTREKLTYFVHPHDSWESIAKRFGVSREQLRDAWNPQEPTLKQGHQLTLWIEHGTLEQITSSEPVFTLQPVPAGGQSVGWPDSGRLLNAVQIPENPALYKVRNPEHGYGSTHAIEVMQRGFATFRSRTGYDRDIIIWDMSTLRGGSYGPHRSHRSGRDVDIGLPLRPEWHHGMSPIGAVDWETTWHLVRALVETGEVRYVFLSRGGQLGLYKAARACGATPAELERIIQWPRTEHVGIVRESPGHTGHIHVRFTCGLDEPACREIGATAGT
ncbi:MAG TPA: penicillin-insensitive murein endopeptidase [Polyangiales bacterium]|jgi:LysM repeat protein